MLSFVVAGLFFGQLPPKPLTLAGGFDTHAKVVKINLAQNKATVLFFIATDCPIANRYAPEIRRIATAYAAKGVQSYRVYVLDKSHVREIVKHGKDFQLSMPAILDPARKIVAETGVKVTPEVAVITPRGQLVYRGRIDDQNVEHGVIRSDYRRDLRIALDEFLAGKPITMPTTAAIGCYL